MINPILSGEVDSGPPHDFSAVAPKRQYKAGVMGYVNLSYYIGKTPKQVSGPKIFFGSGPEALKVGLPENFGTLKSGCFNFHLDQGTKRKGLAQK